MDGISGTAAVIGLVQAAALVTTALSRYVFRVKEAESSRTKLLDQIRLISAAETAISSIVQNSPRSAHTEELQGLIDEWFKNDGPPRKCKRELDALAGWLVEKEAETNKRRRWTQKIGWPVKEDKIQATIRVFEGYMPYFRDILSIKTFELVESMVTKFRNAELVIAKSELLSWLDGFDCTDKHEYSLRRRQPTTGNWFFKEELYIDWRKGSTGFIWLHGKPGAGKSILVSAVIDDLSNGLSDNETLAYFYCDFRNVRCTKAMEVLRSVTKQLLWNSKRDWLSSFSDLTTRRQRGSGPPTDLGTLSDLLHRATELHERPIIVVDALDECEDLSNLLDELTKLAHGHCSLFVTSRALHTIKEAFKGLSTIHLDDRVNETRSDMHFHIKTELESRPRLKILRQELKDEIEGVLMKKADGMFRWVQCQLDRLNDCYSLGDVRMVLDTLPETLYETYDQMLHTIDKKPIGRSRARRALKWLVTALAPLTLSQLAEAMSIKCDKPEWDFDGAPMYETVVLDTLGSLVTIEGGHITLSHYSVKEYLTSDVLAYNTYFVHQPDASLELATVSIFSLVLFGDEFKPGINGKPHLCYYAVHSGLRHLTDCQSDHNGLLMEHLLTLQNHVTANRLIYERNREFYWTFETPQLALYIIIRFGHLALLHCYLNLHPVQATEEDNPLVFAALYSDTPRLQILLGRDLDVNLEGAIRTHMYVRKTRSLTAAARNEREELQDELVKLLIENGCTVSKDALHHVFRCNLGTPCRPAVVRILLENGADPQLLNAEKRSCLHVFLASGSNEFEIACMLVAAGCDPMAPDIWNTSSFHLAIEGLFLEFIQWLIQCGFRLPLDAILHVFSDIRVILCPPGGTRNLLSMLQFLVRHGADTNAQDDHGSNALHLFSGYISRFDEESIKSILQLLVEYGCDINHKNDAGETPLHLAATSSAFKSDILDLFLSQGAELPVDIINYTVRGSLLPPWNWDIISNVRLLVNKFGATCQSKTIDGNNALHCLLLKHGHFRLPPEVVSEVVSFLVENGCDIHATAPSGATPLQLAIENGYLADAQGILSHITKSYSVDCTTPYHGDSNGNGILHRLCSDSVDDKFEEKVKLLREAGYDFTKDINRPNKKGFTPLCIALVLDNAADNPAIVPCLLNLGASFYHVNYVDMEKLKWALNLPWYRDATDVHDRYITRSKTTPKHVILAHHLLRAVHLVSLSSAIVKSILDTAEYWACTKVTKQNVRCPGALANDSEWIAFPTIPGDVERWVPRRLIFTYKAGFFAHRIRDSYAMIRVLVRRLTGSVFVVPMYPTFLCCHAHDPQKVETEIWDEFTPAEQAGGRQRLMIGELTYGDMLNVELFQTDNDYFKLEFFQVEAYYAMATH